MPRNATIPAVQNQWTELTDGDVSTQVMFQNKGGYSVHFQATADANAPTSLGGAVEYQPGQGERDTLANVFPGVSGAVRLWVFAQVGGSVAIQHG
ncbi:MAG: hypothetical protein ACRBB0_26950 [Pelagimonas sp.]|uniref:hypothetical protein n=1 Tax=Pelagimonas sp. TaxID=2073170 RepID=UPI003D6ACAF1